MGVKEEHIKKNLNSKDIEVTVASTLNVYENLSLFLYLGLVDLNEEKLCEIL